MKHPSLLSRTRSLLLVTVLGLALALAACGDHSSKSKTAAKGAQDDKPNNEEPGIDLSKLTPDCFKGGANPVLELGDGFAGATWNDPHVIQVGDEYWMYASANTNFSGNVKIYRLTSTDGTHWTLDPATPVLEPSPGEWDAGGTETPAVVKFGWQYHMFWTGYAPPYPTEAAQDFRIGHATSSDGIHWNKDDTFIVAPTGVFLDFDEAIVGEPGPVVFDDQLYLYFTGVGANAGVGTTLEAIGLTVSADGKTWSDPISVLESDQDVYPRADGWIGYSTPNAVALADGVHLFVDVANEIPEWTQVRLHHAHSGDGRTDWVQDSEAIHRREDFDWTAREIRSTDALLDGLDLRLYFAGDDLFDSGSWGIGLSTCDLSSS